MFSTGFCTQPEGLAEPADSDTLRWMRRYAAGHDCAVAGSVAVQEGGKYYNRFYFVSPDGAVRSYDKSICSRTAESTIVLQPGGNVWSWSSGVYESCSRFATIYVFPYARNRKDYEWRSMWPVGLRRVWKPGWPCYGQGHRNQCYVVGVNRVGTDRLASIAEAVGDRPLRTYGSGL